MPKRKYDNDYSSVTQALGVLRKIALENWFKYNTAAFCDKESAEGKIVGTESHDAIRQHIELDEVKIETQYGEQVMTALNSFMLFKKEHPEIKLKRAEIQLTSEEHQFNGTMDCLGQEEKIFGLLDWKTTKAKKKEKPPIYAESLYQGAAYFKAFNETQECQLEKAYIVSLAKDKVAYDLRELLIPEIEEIFKYVFLPVLSVYNYQKKGGR